jgi:hypothetical protein
MTTTTLNRTGKRWYVGEDGNLSVSPTLKVTLAATPANDVIVFGDKVEPNIKIVGVRLITAALGASTTLTVKVGTTVLVNAQSTASAVNAVIQVDDVVTSAGQEISLVVGGAAATGLVKFKLEYENLGNL